MNERFEKFTNLISEIYRAIQKIKNEEMNNIGLKGKQVQCIYFLYNKDNATMTELVKMCGEDKGAISRTLKELQNENLIYIEENCDKKYKNPIKLTKKGEQIGEFVTNQISGILNSVGAKISLEDRNKLYEVLENILNELNKICVNYRG